MLLSNENKLKDEVLDSISKEFNVAQFASYGPNLIGRFSRIKNHKPNYHCDKIEDTIIILISNSWGKSVNIRTFKPDNTKGNPFYYGITSVKYVMTLLKQLSKQGYYTIVNETIDIKDGGVSGVVMNDIIEFSPNDTPKCVEKPGVCSMPRKIGINILQKTYGFSPRLGFKNDLRVEFSIHSMRRGFRNEHTIIWEIENSGKSNNNIAINWPNNFSRFIGDKVFGLLIAEELGASVPYSTVISRNVAPFTFGRKTGNTEIWLRTSPAEKTPGKYPTFLGWEDPFIILNDPDLIKISSVLAQHSVNSVYSGAAVPSENDILIEGVKGYGDNFMVGKQAPVNLDYNLKRKVSDIYTKLSSTLGKVTIEWVFDGKKVWIVQLSKSTNYSTSKIIYPGTANKYIKFHVADGLEELRVIVDTIEPGTGIELVGIIGITSHFGDILRKAKIPSKLVTINDIEADLFSEQTIKSS